MITVTRGKNTMQLHDNNQLDAFLNGGWEIAQEKPEEAESPQKQTAPAKDAAPVKEEQEATEAKETSHAPKRGRKSTKTE